MDIEHKKQINKFLFTDFGECVYLDIFILKILKKK